MVVCRVVSYAASNYGDTITIPVVIYCFDGRCAITGVSLEEPGVFVNPTNCAFYAKEVTMKSSSEIYNTLHFAIESCDVDGMLSLYAENAEVRVIDRDHPPSRPLELHGKQAIGSYLRDVYGREMRHQVVDEVVGKRGLSFSEDCRYPDGTRVFGNITLELEDGMIVRETEVQAWDETLH